MLRFISFYRTNSLHRKQRVLRTPVAFLANAAFFAPQVAVDGITLRHFVVAETLRKGQPPAVAEFAQQTQNLPLHVGGRFLGGVAEIDFVLDLEPAQLRLEVRQFFVNGHREFSSRQSRFYRGLGTRYRSVTAEDGTKVPNLGGNYLAFAAIFLTMA